MVGNRESSCVHYRFQKCMFGILTFNKGVLTSTSICCLQVYVVFGAALLPIPEPTSSTSFLLRISLWWPGANKAGDDIDKVVVVRGETEEIDRCLAGLALAHEGSGGMRICPSACSSVWYCSGRKFISPPPLRRLSI